MGIFKNRIKELRLERQMSQQDLANKLDVNKQTISQYERGVREPSFEMLLSLCDIFNVSTDYLLGNDSHTSRLVNTEERKMLDAMRGDIPQSDNTNYRKRIPVLGRIAAGLPIEATEHIIDWEEIPEEMSRSGEYFGLVVEGDSMAPDINNKDIVIVRKQDTADNGDVVIAMVNSHDAVCKKFMKYDWGLQLLSNNPAYEPMAFTADYVESLPVRILGKVVELRRKF